VRLGLVAHPDLQNLYSPVQIRTPPPTQSLHTQRLPPAPQKAPPAPDSDATLTQTRVATARTCQASLLRFKSGRRLQPHSPLQPLRSRRRSPLAPDWAGTDGFAPPLAQYQAHGERARKGISLPRPEGAPIRLVTGGAHFSLLVRDGTLRAFEGVLETGRVHDAGRRASEGGSLWTQAGRGDRRCSMRTRWRGGRRRLRSWRMRQHRRRSACRPWAAATDPQIENVVTTAPRGSTAELLGRLRLLREGAELLLDRCDQWLRALPRRQSPRRA